MRRNCQDFQLLLNSNFELENGEEKNGKERHSYFYREVHIIILDLS